MHDNPWIYDPHDHFWAERRKKLVYEPLTELAVLDGVAKLLDRQALLYTRSVLAEQFPEKPQLLDLIDGNLALREIQHGPDFTD